jgi:mono/diheme cytochrome c family protein
MHARLTALSLTCLATLACQGQGGTAVAATSADAEALRQSREDQRLRREGRDVFRYDTFGDEAFWTDVLHLEQAIGGAGAVGGSGAGLSPRTALAVGLKVDVDALPHEVQEALAAGQVDLDDPAVTLALLEADAVVGVKGTFDRAGRLARIGIQCALCHSTVDDALAPGVGRRLDGWPNQDLDVGAIVSIAPNLQPVADLLSLAGPAVDVPTLKAVLGTWGPGFYDASVFLDGQALRPDGGSAAVRIPPAFGLAGVNLATWTGWGTVTYWNAFVANLEMHGQGTFHDPRLDDAARFPVAARAGFGRVRASPDLVTPKLAALHRYQLSLAAPRPPEGSFDEAAAARGRRVFEGAGDCARCHVPPLFTEPGFNLHAPAELGIDGFQAGRSPTGMYRTAPLAGLWAHSRRGFFHDGRFATLEAVVDHYDAQFALGLTAAQKADLVEYLRSL